jgi:alpha-beta hydrolase superfamily lysophospholipase
MLDDITAFIQQAKQRYSSKPYFIYGHSMGGNLVINYALRRKPDLGGVIATDPFLKLAFAPPAIKMALGRLMNNIAPAFIQASGLETAALSRDPKVVDAYVNDRLVHNKISARLFVGLFDQGQYAFDHASEFPLPMLLMHGTADRLTSAEATRQFGAAAPAFVTTKLWDGLFHEIHNEPEKADVLKTYIQWLDGQMKN